jgi:hypothetical protein
MGSYILPSAAEKKKGSTYQGRRYEQKKEREKKAIYQEAQRTSSWTRGLKS